MHSQTQQITGF